MRLRLSGILRANESGIWAIRVDYTPRLSPSRVVSGMFQDRRADIWWILLQIMGEIGLPVDHPRFLALGFLPPDAAPTDAPAAVL